MGGWDGLNRRKFPRVKYPCLVTARLKGNGPDIFLTHTENLGIGGVCVILKKGYKLFSPVELEIDLLDTSDHIKCKGRVVWCIQRRETEKKKPSFFDTGIEFTDITPEEQSRVQAIVKTIVKQGTASPYV